MTPSKILFYLCLSFIGGIFLSSTGWNFFPSWIFFDLGILTLGVLAVSLFCQFKKLVIFSFCLLFFTIGVWRHQTVISEIEGNLLRNHWNQNVILTGIIDAEPERRKKTTKLSITLQTFQPDEERSRHIEGRVLITKWHYPQYEYGDRIIISGKLEEPESFEGFDYKNYLAKDRIFALMYQPKIELIEKNQANSLKKFLISTKNKLKISLNKAIPFPQAPIMEALLFGEEDNISEEWKKKLNLTGTRHIAAVSGMNITILTFLLSDFLLRLGLYRWQSFYFSIILIVLYILMIGAPSSAIRAGIMATLFLTAQHFGRIAASSRTVILAASWMLALNPLLLIYDVGFQLSFLAVMGLIYLQPSLSDFFKKIPNTFQLRYNLSGTLAAQIFTLPVLIYNFGQVSPISPITNILVLPIIPMTTILGFVFSILGAFWGNLGQAFSWPAYFLLSYLIKIIDFFSKTPLATLTFNNVSWLFVLISYLILFFLTWRLQEKQKLKFLNY